MIVNRITEFKMEVFCDDPKSFYSLRAINKMIRKNIRLSKLIGLKEEETCDHYYVEFYWFL